jgi:Tol biopolymer transport system component
MKYFSFIVLTISFFGYSQSQKPVVIPFLESIVKQFPNVRDITLSPNQDEVLFSAQSYMGDISVLLSVKKVKNEWLEPKIVSFSGVYFDLEPYFSPNGLSLYFVSNRPLDSESKEIKDFDIWYVTRKTSIDEWSQPINLGAPVNTAMDEFYPAVGDSRNIYFTLDNPELNQKDTIYMSAYVGGTYQQPKQLNEGINSDGYEFNAFVSPDESLIIYTSYNREGGFGSGDLYMSRKLIGGEWGASENLGATINSDKMDYCPFVNMSTHTLYFTSKRNSLNMVSGTSISQLKALFKSYENGLSRLYQVKIKDLLSEQN